MIRQRGGAPPPSSTSSGASNQQIYARGLRSQHRGYQHRISRGVFLVFCFMLVALWLNVQPPQGFPVVYVDSSTSSPNPCEPLLQAYNESLRNRSEYSGHMLKRLEVQAAGCGSQLPDVPYHWDQQPLTNNSAPLQDGQLIHLFYDNVTQDVSFVVASALATKVDWRNLRILVWLDAPTYQKWQQEPPPNFPDCQRHVTVLE